MMPSPVTNGTTHDCPGGCGRQIMRSLLACRADWYRLPADLRNAVNGTYRARTQRSHSVDATEVNAHREALQAAIAWYGDNPRSTR